MKQRCPYTFAQAGSIIRNRVHEARFPPHGAFWITEGRPLHSREIKAYKNSNHNRTTKLEILWAQDEPRRVTEMESGNSNRTIYFVRNQDLSSSEEDPSEPSMESDEGTISLNEPVTLQGSEGGGGLLKDTREMGLLVQMHSTAGFGPSDWTHHLKGLSMLWVLLQAQKMWDSIINAKANYWSRTTPNAPTQEFLFL